MQQEYPIDQEAYQTWLETKEPDAVIGICVHPTECVIARFLRETEGKKFSITGYWLRLLSGNPEEERTYSTPTWAMEEVFCFDRLEENGGIERVVTKAEYDREMPPFRGVR